MFRYNIHGTYVLFIWVKIGYFLLINNYNKLNLNAIIYQYSATTLLQSILFNKKNEEKDGYKLWIVRKEDKQN